MWLSIVVPVAATTGVAAVAVVVVVRHCFSAALVGVRQVKGLVVEGLRGRLLTTAAVGHGHILRVVVALSSIRLGRLLRWLNARRWIPQVGRENGRLGEELINGDNQRVDALRPQRH